MSTTRRVLVGAMPAIGLAAGATVPGAVPEASGDVALCQLAATFLTADTLLRRWDAAGPCGLDGGDLGEDLMVVWWDAAERLSTFPARTGAGREAKVKAALAVQRRMEEIDSPHLDALVASALRDVLAPSVAAAVEHMPPHQPDPAWNADVSAFLAAV